MPISFVLCGRWVPENDVLARYAVRVASGRYNLGEDVPVYHAVLSSRRLTILLER